MQGISAAGTLARYFSLRFLIAMIAMFILCCVLIFFVDFIEMLRRAGNYQEDVPGLLLAWMTLLRLPSFSELTLPFAVLIGAIGVFLMLSRSSELIVVRAAGISVWQFILPGLIVAFLLGVVFVLVYNPIAAAARGQAEQLYARAFDRDNSLLKTKNAGAWLREDGADGPSVSTRCRCSIRASNSPASPCSNMIASSNLPNASKRNAQCSRRAVGNWRMPASASPARSPSFTTTTSCPPI